MAALQPSHPVQHLRMLPFSAGALQQASIRSLGLPRLSPERLYQARLLALPQLISPVVNNQVPLLSPVLLLPRAKGVHLGPLPRVADLEANSPALAVLGLHKALASILDIAALNIQVASEERLESQVLLVHLGDTDILAQVVVLGQLVALEVKQEDPSLLLHSVDKDNNLDSEELHRDSRSPQTSRRVALPREASRVLRVVVLGQPMASLVHRELRVQVASQAHRALRVQAAS